MLWTWTTQGFEPKPPYVADGDEFEPYGVGYVEFAGLPARRGPAHRARPDALAIGMPMEVVAVERAGRTTYAFAPVPRMTDVAIVGVGIHPFGRHDGVSALAMGAYAVRAALADAGLAWSDMQFAYGGSEDGGNADTMVTELGPTGLPFINVKNGCATGGSSLVCRRHALQSGAYDVGARRRLRQASARRVPERSRRTGRCPAWYGEDGLMVTTQFFGAKLQRYMHDHDIPPPTLAQVAEKAFANGARTPHAWRRTPLSADEILGSPMLAHPLTQYMLCSPGRGRGRARRLPARVPRAAARRAAGLAALGRVPHASRRLVRGVQPVAAARDRAVAVGRRRARGVRGAPASRPTRSTSRRCRTPSRAPS